MFWFLLSEDFFLPDNGSYDRYIIKIKGQDLRSVLIVDTPAAEKIRQPSRKLK